MATMNTGLGGPAGYGDGVFSSETKASGGNDDGSVLVDIKSAFGDDGLNYFGTEYTDIYINSNGSITFNSALTTHVPTPVANITQPAIVPLWADVNIGSGGEIYWDVDPTAGTVIVTWHDVAPYSGSGSNSYQVVLTSTGGGDFDVEFIYEDIQWSNGGSGVGVAGITDGGTQDLELEGSGNSTAVLGYDGNDFDGGDPLGTFSLNVVGGVPDAYWVEGTSGNDTMELGYTDADGNQITSSDDVIDGGDGNDSIDGDGGDDTIFAGSGDDTVQGGTGDDSIDGGLGADSIDGGANHDVIHGGAGDDTIDGGAGNDTIFGEDGNDLIYEGSNTDNPGEIHGGDGNDTIYGGTGASSDLLIGDAGDDLIVDLGTHSTSNDTLQGGSGSDTLDGGEGADLLEGGDDADTFLLNDDFGNDTIVGGEGGADDDTIDLTGLTGPVTVNYTGNEVGTISDGSDTIAFSEVENIFLSDFADNLDGSSDSVGFNIFAGSGDDSITGGSGDDYVSGGDGNDTINTGTSSDSVDGGLGDDSISGSGTGNLFDGGDGADTIYASGGQSTLIGGDGDDSLSFGFNGRGLMSGDGGNDYLKGYSGTDTIYGGTGDDTIVTGGGGADLLYGEEGADHFIVQEEMGTPGNSLGDATISGGENDSAIDTVDFSGHTSSVTVSYTGDESATFTDGTDSGQFEGIEQVLLTDFADVLSATADTEGISVAAGEGNDTITGGSGSDTIDGGIGNDSITGGAGNDSITGGDGSDIFTYSAGDGSDTITDFNTGNSGTLSDGINTNNDSIDLTAFYDNLSELYADQADDGILNQSNTTDSKGRVIDYSDNDDFGSGSLTFTGASADKSSFTQENTGVVCFTSGTAIRTPGGDVLIDDLKVGDLVITSDNGPKPIRWIGRRKIGYAALLANPKLRPILIPKGILSAERNLLVSRQHALLDTQNNLVRAIHLTGSNGIRIAHGKRSVIYFHLMFDAHEIIFAENAAAESFYPGPFALEMFDPVARTDFFRNFPELRPTFISGNCIVGQYGATAREIVKEGGAFSL